MVAGLGVGFELAVQLWHKVATPRLARIGMAGLYRWQRRMAIAAQFIQLDAVLHIQDDIPMDSGVGREDKGCSQQTIE